MCLGLSRYISGNHIVARVRSGSLVLMEFRYVLKSCWWFKFVYIGFGLCSSSLNPKPETPDPKPQTLSPKPLNPENPKPPTLNPKPPKRSRLWSLWVELHLQPCNSLSHEALKTAPPPSSPGLSELFRV